MQTWSLQSATCQDELKLVNMHKNLLYYEPVHSTAKEEAKRQNLVTLADRGKFEKSRSGKTASMQENPYANLRSALNSTTQ